MSSLDSLRSLPHEQRLAAGVIPGYLGLRHIAFGKKFEASKLVISQNNRTLKDKQGRRIFLLSFHARKVFDDGDLFDERDPIGFQQIEPLVESANNNRVAVGDRYLAFDLIRLPRLLNSVLSRPRDRRCSSRMM